MSQEPLSTKPKKKTPHLERVTINPNVIPRVDSWKAQVSENVKGVRITRSDVVNWVLNQHSEQLSSSEMKSFEKAHFDEVKYLEWAIQQAKKAKRLGSEIELESILSVLKPSKIEKKIRNRTKKKSDSSKQSKHPQNEGAQSEEPQNDAPNTLNL